MIPDVQVCVLPGADADEVRRYVAEWAWAVATRHGDVAPAEVLAEALAWVSPRARLERLGYRFVAVEGADGAEVDVVAPDGSWRRLDASWPDGERAAAEARALAAVPRRFADDAGAKDDRQASLPDAVRICPQCPAVAGVGVEVVLYLRGDADARRAQIEDHEASAAHVEAARKTVEVSDE